MRAGAVLLIVALAAALSVDVVKTGYGLKGDEATYVSMALSLAYDHDLTYERRDLDRFFGLYRSGPDGIFLKKGKQLRFRTNSELPFIHEIKTPDKQADRLYFAKALLYPVVAAPFVWLLGLNGFLVLHVLLLFGVCVCGYTFLAARSQPAAAMIFTLAFVGATCVPVYTVFLVPEILNFSLIFFAYFLWLYKEVKPDAPGWLRGRGSDIAAAILLGAAVYSKPPNALLVAPLVLWFWWRRKWVDGFLVGAVSVVVACAFFGLTAMNTGEFNYQGGDRKTFYTAFPLDGSKDSVWDRKGTEMSTNDSDSESVLQDFTNRFAHNVEYFLVGRHFGFVPYYFPGVVAIGLWLFSRERRDAWRLLTFLAVLGSAVGLLIWAPYTWSGGGGPSGNRYIIGVYAAIFFLTPPLTSTAPAVLAWLGGALFTAKMLVNPFVAAKAPYLTTERGFARYLPVEVTMANDLPIVLIEGPRAHSWFNGVLLYFLDEHAYPPEVIDPAGHTGVWIAGDGRADMVMRSDWPIGRLQITVESRVPTTFVVSAGSTQTRIPLLPDKPVTFDVPASGVRDLSSYAYLLSARSTEGFIEHLRNPASKDDRNLGVLMRFTAIPAGK
ncbi:MAG TPA: hypothetical protein VKI43_14395 [Vicinamibacterales bacterium]|nr:hypothetical protein [Vicinamibacterales bacterium]